MGHPEKWVKYHLAPKAADASQAMIDPTSWGSILCSTYIGLALYKTQGRQRFGAASFGGIMGLISLRAFGAFVVCVTLVSCGSLPRGAGLQSEVLAASDTQTTPEGEAVYDFAVFEVRRDLLPTLRDWPQNGAVHRHWINQRTQPASLALAPGDVLDLTIWDAEENSLLTNSGQRVTQLPSTPINSDGRIFVPFVGNLKVSGMSPQSARARIEQELTQTAPSAQVQLSVKPGQANTANLVSGMNAPGVYPLPNRNTSLLSVLSQGGGVQARFDNPQITLQRGNQVYVTALERVFDDPSLDTTLVGGDRIIIEEDDRYFLSLGAAGSEALHPFPKNQVTALEALSIIGGVSDTRANPQGILVLREYASNAVRTDLHKGPPQTRVVFTIDLTHADGLFSAGEFQIQPKDLIYATESPVTSASTVFGILGSVLGLAGSL